MVRKKLQRIQDSSAPSTDAGRRDRDAQAIDMEAARGLCAKPSQDVESSQSLEALRAAGVIVRDFAKSPSDQNFPALQAALEVKVRTASPLVSAGNEPPIPQIVARSPSSNSPASEYAYYTKEYPKHWTISTDPEEIAPPPLSSARRRHSHRSSGADAPSRFNDRQKRTHSVQLPRYAVKDTRQIVSEGPSRLELWRRQEFLARERSAASEDLGDPRVDGFDYVTTKSAQFGSRMSSQVSGVLKVRESRGSNDAKPARIRRASSTYSNYSY